MTITCSACAMNGNAGTGSMANCDAPAAVCFEQGEGSFALIQNNEPATVLHDDDADPAIRRVAANFAADLERVSGNSTMLSIETESLEGTVVVIGELGHSAILDDLMASGKLVMPAFEGAWEAFQIAVVNNPWPNVPRALVIAGSDRRGAVFGAYDLSEKIGVSPWYWFADVPVQQQSDVYITAGARRDQPKVKYRGIFINDEDPAFSSWANINFGGINAEMYEHVFELILRLKGNYLWPAMWSPKMFHVDDPQNTIVADEMGIIMGTSHHEPLTRAHAEWHHNPDVEVGGGPWDYAQNAENLRTFWRGGIERMMSKGDGTPYESLVTVGMRGDGDEPMSEETAIQLLETVVADQRQIIEDVTGKPAAETPQVWALYKEVQSYYDQGMQVPEDVTLLFADDNWGQIRRLPTADFDRPGGYGVYYHFDYVGAPRNYKWLNTIQVEQVWQQMDLAYQRHARALWVVNVGDLKPVEYPIDFFLRMAWNPEAMTADALREYPEDWARQLFGNAVASDIAELVTLYSKYAARRTPELINETVFALGEGAGDTLDGGEFGHYVALWKDLATAMEATKQHIQPEQQSAYYQLIEYPILALGNLYEMYYATAWNHRLADLDDPRANYFAEVARAAFEKDAELSAAYHALENGKWEGMMDQVHMGYTIWQTPQEQHMPALRQVGDGNVDIPEVVFATATPAYADATVIEASAFDRATNAPGMSWTSIPHLGQAEAGVIVLPQGAPSTTEADSMYLAYDFETSAVDTLRVNIHLSPTLDTFGADGIRMGISLDDGPITTLLSPLEPTCCAPDTPGKVAWYDAVINNREILDATFGPVQAGRHTLKLWRLDDNIILERIVIENQQ